jgi:hypothetical protein
MNHPHRLRARVIAVALPVEQPKQASLLAAVAFGALASIAVYVIASLLS